MTALIALNYKTPRLALKNTIIVHIETNAD
jgi:hypothetical protein